MVGLYLWWTAKNIVKKVRKMGDHFGNWCARRDSRFCQERDGCSNCAVICSRIDKCFKIKMVMDKDLAGDWQYAEVIRNVCNACDPEKERR